MVREEIIMAHVQWVLTVAITPSPHPRRVGGQEPS